MAAFPRVFPFAVTVAAALLPASRIVAQANPGEQEALRLVGQVVDITTGAPVAGARVSVAASEWMSLTNPEGRFILSDLDPGPHQLSVEQLGYHSLVTRVQAREGAAPLEIGIEPDPILLEGLEVVSRRFERRRRAAGIRVTEFDRNDLVSSAHLSAAAMLEERLQIRRIQCRDGGFECISARGQGVRPTVCVDEVPMIEGWNALAAYRAHEFYAIEVYGRGGFVRAYTHPFMERASRIRFLPAAVGAC